MPEFVAVVPGIRLAAAGRYFAAGRALVVGNSHWPEASAVR